MFGHIAGSSKSTSGSDRMPFVIGTISGVSSGHSGAVRTWSPASRTPTSDQ